jgi:hypothetical protein
MTLTLNTRESLPGPIYVARQTLDVASVTSADERIGGSTICACVFAAPQHNGDAEELSVVSGAPHRRTRFEWPS